MGQDLSNPKVKCTRCGPRTRTGASSTVGTFSDRAQALKAFDQANSDIDKRAFITPITKGDEYYERLKHSWVEVPAFNKPNSTVATGAPRPVVRPGAATGFVYDSNAKKSVASLEGTKWKTLQGGTVEFSRETMTADMRGGFGPEYSDRAAEKRNCLIFGRCISPTPAAPDIAGWALGSAG